MKILGEITNVHEIHEFISKFTKLRKKHENHENRTKIDKPRKREKTGAVKIREKTMKKTFLTHENGVKNVKFKNRPNLDF